MAREDAPAAAAETRVVRGACPHDCPDTCAMLVTVQGGRVVRIQGDPDHPPTHGALCTKVSRYAERTLHPQPIVFQPDPALPNEMLAVLGIWFIAVFFLATWLISLQTDTERAAQRVSALRAEFDHREIA